MRLEVRVIPVGHLVLMVCDEFDRTVLGDHNCNAVRVLAAVAKSGLNLNFPPDPSIGWIA